MASYDLDFAKKGQIWIILFVELRQTLNIILVLCYMMIEWFSHVLCWKYDGAIDSSAVAQAYVWLVSEFGRFAASASCVASPSMTI